MKTKYKTRSALLSGAAVLALLPGIAQADPISGGISFSGGYTPFQADGITRADDLTTAASIVFGGTTTTTANGSFAGILSGTAVTMFSPLLVNPAVVPPGSLWSVGGFSFRLSTLSEVADTASILSLSGSGTLSDGIPADSTTGTWVASFTSQGDTFAWASSSAAAAPDAGGTLMLLGMGMTGLALFSRHGARRVESVSRA